MPPDHRWGRPEVPRRSGHPRKNRLNDLRRIYDLWEANKIDGLFTLAALGRFRDELQAAARRLGLS
jgi:hypothetical protein